MVVDATARPEVSVERLEQEVAREVDAMHERGVTDAEVERAIALIRTDIVRALQSASDRADQLSRFATYFGDPSLVNEQMDRYREVTASQATSFAREYLGRENRASLVYVPRVTTVGGDGARGVRREVREPAGVDA
jgi:predicted Zn-dependent peptidase